MPHILKRASSHVGQSQLRRVPSQRRLPSGKHQFRMVVGAVNFAPVPAMEGCVRPAFVPLTGSLSSLGGLLEGQQPSTYLALVQTGRRNSKRAIGLVFGAPKVPRSGDPSSPRRKKVQRGKMRNVADSRRPSYHTKTKAHPLTISSKVLVSNAIWPSPKQTQDKTHAFGDYAPTKLSWHSP
ncbi:hypothetical protein V8C34DRAFT_312825 [Trichoderma compactum]